MILGSILRPKKPTNMDLKAKIVCPVLVTTNWIQEFSVSGQGKKLKLVNLRKFKHVSIQMCLFLLVWYIIFAKNQEK